jgi:hypothetical protein
MVGVERVEVFLKINKSEKLMENSLIVVFNLSKKIWFQEKLECLGDRLQREMIHLEMILLGLIILKNLLISRNLQNHQLSRDKNLFIIGALCRNQWGLIQLINTKSEVWWIEQLIHRIAHKLRGKNLKEIFWDRLQHQLLRTILRSMISWERVRLV